MKTVVSFVLSILLAVVGAGADDLKVLPDKIGEVAPAQMTSAYLRQLAAKAFETRRAQYEQRKTPEQLAEYQRNMRQFFVRQLGGFPERTPLNAQVVGKLEGDGFRVEKLIYESRPRHYVTAALYLPETDPPYPAVLVPSGHSRNAKAAGYNQSGCMLLANNGIAALCYDPIGQGERFQLLDDQGKPRFKSTTEHTLLGVGSILVGRNTASYRIWDGMRSIDYLAGRKEIDASRIGCTGCSGGGTLTSYLMALDDRVACASPSCYLTSFERLIETIGPQDAEQNIAGQIAAGMDHADYAMIRAPKPTLICAATGDFFDISGTWDGFREAKRFYTRLGFPERVALLESDTRHGYGSLHREGTVRWMRRWLLGEDDAITEPELATFSDEQLQCTPEGQVMRLAGARSVVDFNVAEEERLAGERERFWKTTPREEALAQVRRIAGVRTLAELPAPQIERAGTVDHGAYRMDKLVLRTEPGIHLPALLFVPATPSGKRYRLVNDLGKQAVVGRHGAVAFLVEQGHVVLAIDVRSIGETGGGGSEQWGGNFKDIFLAYLLGKSFTGMWAEDIMIAARYLREQEDAGKPAAVNLVASGTLGPAALHAVALEPDLFSAVRLDRAVSTWSHLVRHPDANGGLINAVHAALATYDLPDLVRAIGVDRVHFVDPIGKTEE